MNNIRTKALKWVLKMIEPFQDDILKHKAIRVLLRKFYNISSPDEWILTELEGVKIYINTLDVGLFRSFIIQRKYEEGTTKVFKRILRKGMTVIDIRACTGYYSLIASKIIGEKGKIFAFEPHPINYKWLKRGIEINSFTNVIPINKAIADRNGSIRLFCSTKNISDHSVVFTENRGYVEVEAITLDKFCQENQILPDVVKIDIEGAELLALRGMEKTIEACENLALFIEFQYNLKAIMDFLREHAFSIQYITKEGKLTEHEEKDVERNIFCVKGCL
jgi:FkbM family methyltransferase